MADHWRQPPREDDHDMWCAIALGIVLFGAATITGAAAWWLWQVGLYLHWWGWDGTVRLPPRL